jgi:hypothetical protein
MTFALTSRLSPRPDPRVITVASTVLGVNYLSKSGALSGPRFIGANPRCVPHLNGANRAAVRHFIRRVFRILT